MKITKAELNKILVDERKKSRTKAQQSAFMKKTLSIYNGQKKRRGGELPFTIQEFRTFFAEGLESPCPFSGQKLTINSATADHKDPVARGGSYELSNLEVCTQSSNWQKSTLSRESFVKLLNFLSSELLPEEEIDIKRRLSIGGKWSFR